MCIRRKIVGEEMSTETHRDLVMPNIRTADEKLLEQFKVENKILEDEWHFRHGAKYTANFGIEDGWGPDMEDGWIRIHQGVDRARGRTYKNLKDPVICPLHFDKSGFVDYKGKGYGSLVFLTSKKYQFELRIAHMDPVKDMVRWTLKQLKKHKPIQQGWQLGSAGNYGYSTGAHTHTELVSTDESCEIFDLLLLEQHGEIIFKEYSDEFIVLRYRQQIKNYPETCPYVDYTDGEILTDWTNQKKKRKVFFINDYKTMFFWGDKAFSRYSSNLVLKGL